MPAGGRRPHPVADPGRRRRMDGHGMEMAPEWFETVVVGAARPGWRSATTCRRRGRSFVILDAPGGSATGDRWESLRLYTPARYSGLPGLGFPAAAGTTPPRTRWPATWRRTQRFQLPVRSGVRVDGLSFRDGRYLVTAGARRFEAGNVVVATGAFHPRSRASPPSWTLASASSTPAATGAGPAPRGRRPGRRGGQLGGRDRPRAGGRRPPDLAVGPTRAASRSGPAAGPTGLPPRSCGSHRPLRWTTRSVGGSGQAARRPPRWPGCGGETWTPPGSSGCRERPGSATGCPCSRTAGP